ncbi:SGNH/GDSL hydrolase family protein [Microbacterium sp. KNMS]
MGGVTAHGIRYPDGTSKAKNLGPELKTMAEDIDRVYTDTTDGGVLHELVEDIAEQVVPPIAQAEVEERMGDYVPQPEKSVAAFDTPFVSENDYVFGGVNNDGSAGFVKPIGGLPSVESAVQQRTALVSENGYIFGWIYDDGTVEFVKLATGTDAGEGGGIAEGQTVSDRFSISCVGDSLTEGFELSGVWPAADTWPYKLGQLNPGATVHNLGVSGLTVDEIGVSIGALPLELTAAVTVPTSGPVNIPIQAGIGWRPTGTKTFHGRLGGIPGTVTRAEGATTTLTFEADALASATNLPAGTQFLGDPNTRRWDLLIIGAGRNDISYNVTGAHGDVVTHVTAGLERIVGWMLAQRKRFLIWGTTNSTEETTGTGKHAQVLAVNDWCKRNYPNVYIDIRTWLVKDAIYDIGLTPTSDDLAHMADDAPPPQIMSDAIHWHKSVAAQMAPIFDLALRRRDWKV